MFSKLQAHLDMIMAVEPQQSRALYQGTFTESRAMLVDNPRLHSLADPVHLWSYTLRHKKNTQKYHFFKCSRPVICRNVSFTNEAWRAQRLKLQGWRISQITAKNVCSAGVRRHKKQLKTCYQTLTCSRNQFHALFLHNLSVQPSILEYQHKICLTISLNM